MQTERQRDVTEPEAAPAVRELLAQIAAERRLDFEPTPAAVAAALPELVEAVERIADRLADPQERRWLAAALAALSHQVQADAVRLDVTDGAEEAQRPCP